jgi:hypothetical protein
METDVVREYGLTELWRVCEREIQGISNSSPYISYSPSRFRIKRRAMSRFPSSVTMTRTFLTNPRLRERMWSRRYMIFVLIVSLWVDRMVFALQSVLLVQRHLLIGG